MQKTATILFADVAGSSRLYKAEGDARAQALIGAVIADMASVTAEHGGEVIKTIGDEVMAAFDTAEAAVRSAIAMQRGRLDAVPRIELRIGLHHGPILAHDQDVFGEAVNDAAHLVRIALRGQIITSGDTVSQLPDGLQERSHPFDQVRLKGSRETTAVYRIEWESGDRQSEGPAESTRVLTAAVDVSTLMPPPGRLELEYQGRRFELGPEDGPFVVGRDPAAVNLPVQSDVASRAHFHIEYRRGKYVLVDASTNGTWVGIDGRDPIYLRREELPLAGTGRISIGRAIADDDPHLIRFVV